MAKEKDEGASILDLNLKDREAIEPVSEGEYELEIRAASVQDLGTKKARISIACEVQGDDAVSADDVWHTLWYPNDEDTAKQGNRKKNAIADFIQAIGLEAEVARIDLSEWIGLKFWAVLKMDVYEGTEKNIIGSIIPGR